MTPTPIFPGVYSLTLGPVNVFYIHDGDALTLIDTGNVGDEQAILAGARSLGVEPSGIRQIVLTHCHPDHAGSLAALLEVTDAQVWAHRIEAEIVRGNTTLPRPTAGPGLLNWFLYRQTILKSSATIPNARVDHEVADGDVLPFGGGLRALHTPGHSAGHLAFLLERDGALLFAGDVCSNLPSLNYSIGYESVPEGRLSLARLATLNFATVCFGHGKALTGSAARRFNRKWA